MSRAPIRLILVCAAGLAAGFVLGPSLLSPRLSIHPIRLELSGKHIEGEPLEARFELRNESRLPLTITSLPMSCGCMSLSGPDGPLKGPFALPAGASWPVRLQVATAGRVGPQEFFFSARGQTVVGAKCETNAAVRADLVGTLRAEPLAIVFQRVCAGRSYDAQIELADMLDDPGVRIGEVRVSNGRTMRVALEDESGRSNVFGESVAAHRRGTLRLVYTPDASEGRIQEAITVVPADREFSTLQIPVYCEIAPPPVRLAPRGLTIAAGEQFHRRVWVDTNDGVRDIAVVRQPEGILVEIKESRLAAREIAISGRLPATPHHVAVVLRVNDQEFELPIITVSDD